MESEPAVEAVAPVKHFGPIRAVDVIRAFVSGLGTERFAWKLLYVFATRILLLEIAMRSLANRLIY